MKTRQLRVVHAITVLKFIACPSSKDSCLTIDVGTKMEKKVLMIVTCMLQEFSCRDGEEGLPENHASLDGKEGPFGSQDLNDDDL